jgi:O-antigen/teichoic acid export membrane protein
MGMATITPDMLRAEGAVLEMEQAAAPIAGASAAAPRFRTNFIWTLASNVLYAACQWMMLVAMAKLCAPAEVGIFALGLAVTAPVLMLANLQLRSVQATDARGSYVFNEYFVLRLMTTGLSLILILILAALPSRSAGAAATIAIIGCSKCFEAMSDVLQGYLQRQEQMVVVAKSMLLKGLVSILFLCAAISISPTARAAALGICLGSALTFAIYDWPMTSKFRATFEADHAPAQRVRLLSLAWLALPLGVVQGLVSLGANIPRYYLERFAGPKDLGIYSALASLIIAGQTVVSALGNVSSPRLARSFAAGKLREYWKQLLVMMAVGLALGAGGVGVSAIMGRPLLKLLFRPEYAASSDVLILLMIAGTVAYLAWFAGFGMTAAREFRSQIPLLAASCLAAWAASVWLVPSRGLHGAAMALMLSMSVQLIGAVIILVRIGRRTTGALHAC